MVYPSFTSSCGDVTAGMLVHAPFILTMCVRAESEKFVCIFIYRLQSPSWPRWYKTIVFFNITGLVFVFFSNPDSPTLNLTLKAELKHYGAVLMKSHVKKLEQLDTGLTFFISCWISPLFTVFGMVVIMFYVTLWHIVMSCMACDILSVCMYLDRCIIIIGMTDDIINFVWCWNIVLFSWFEFFINSF